MVTGNHNSAVRGHTKKKWTWFDGHVDGAARDPRGEERERNDRVSGGCVNAAESREHARLRNSSNSSVVR